MVWFFARGNEAVRVETRFDNTSREYVLEVGWANRPPETERFRDHAAFEARVANVEARLRPGLRAIDVLRATFPAGTVSGAPKVRAMEIIDELEPVKRGIYAGAVGYLGFHGNMDVAIALRTAVIKDGVLHVQAGGGIVADSEPQAEWQETQNKAKALLRAAEMAESGLDTRLA